MVKLDVLGATLEVLQGVWVHFFDLLRVAWFGLLLIASAIVLPLIIAFFTQDETALVIGGGGTFLVLYLIGFSLCAVHWHRLVLQGVEHASRMVRVSSVLRYLWTIFKTFLLFYGSLALAILFLSSKYADKIPESLIPFAKLIGVLAALICIPAIILLPRMTLALPDLAIGGRGRLLEAIRQTRGNTIRLWLYTLLCSIVMGLLERLSDKAGEYLSSLAEGSAVQPLLMLSAASGVVVPLLGVMFVTMFGVTMLSVAYGEIIGEPGHEPA